MPARCLNKVQLIGNLTRDPELRYTPSGSAVCSFGMATNRYWTTDTGERKEDAQFYRIVTWNKLAEICSQLLGRGDRVYIEGRLQTRKWTGADGVSRTTTEIVASDMILLKSQRGRDREEMPEAEGPPEIVETPTEGALEAQAPVTEGAEEIEAIEKSKVAAPASKTDDAKVKAETETEKEEEKETKEKKGEEKEGKSDETETETESEDVEIPEKEMPF